MEAKDTVMSMKEIDYIRNSTVARDMADNAREAGKQEGIKEVVELWMKRCPECGSYIPQNINGTRTLRCPNPQCNWDGQAQLKEWGIEEGQ